ncbi:predicted protein [Uncinocarpus reesii 1704]|uniref:SnoaL-like domain-containing protein n=1 Tax=Uncinocarpus reesii (strain UAMH 1704) TaxID=336963 RepID=C4JP67_UNCRE|nr:uncharacterized protein UREG_03126 [Uncinocarpus reesii 1704]EEP78281.1 predicted protein [Uncinocarpus reesii 1704]
MTPEQWVRNYAHAWETRNTYEIVSLFTPDASYYSYVFDEPHVGHNAIQLYWETAAGQQREIKVRMAKPIVSSDGEEGTNRAAVEWWTTMVDPEKGPVSVTGVMLVKFTVEGLCWELWEYWELQDGMREPPEGWGGID